MLLFVTVCVSVLDLSAFERQNKAEGLGMAMDESSGTVFIWKKENPFLLSHVIAEQPAVRSHPLKSHSHLFFSSLP